MNDELLELLRDDMEKAVAAHKQKLAKVRTGRASLALLDGVRVDYYGTPTPLNQVASLAIPEPRVITISPWDKSAISPIEKALQKSGLGLNPSSDGKLVRLIIPELTGDRRKDLVKEVKKMAEEARVVLRGKRREYLEEVKDLLKKKEISEDDERRYQEQIQTITDDFVAKADEASNHKEKEIIET